MSKNKFTGTATQPQRNRNATAHFVNLIMTSTVTFRLNQYDKDQHKKKSRSTSDKLKFFPLFLQAHKMHRKHWFKMMYNICFDKYMYSKKSEI